MAVKTRKKKRSGGKRRKARSTATVHRPKRRRKARRAKKAARHASFRRKASGRIRPVVIVSGSGFRRPAKSKYFSGPTRINKRRRRYGRARKNPFSGGALSIRKVFNKNTLMRYVALGGGIGLGSLLSRFLNTGAVPFMTAPAVTPSWVATLQKVRPLHGLIHILVGVTLASKIRNPIAKDVGAGLAALGGFDLLMQGLSKLGVVGLPTFSGMNVDLMGMNVDTRVVRVAGNGYSDEADDFVNALDT